MKGKYVTNIRRSQTMAGIVSLDSRDNHRQYIARLNHRRTQRLRQARLDSNCISIDIHRYDFAHCDNVLFSETD